MEVDRGRFASLPAETLAPLHLELGRALSDDALRQLQAAADEEAAARAALRALSLRSYARVDLRRRLMQKQHPPAAVERRSSG